MSEFPRFYEEREKNLFIKYNFCFYIQCMKLGNRSSFISYQKLQNCKIQLENVNIKCYKA
jgi:hypothetical protein